MVGVCTVYMYVLIPDESLPCNWGNDDDPCEEEELGAGCSELRSDPIVFQPFPFVSPKLVSRDALPFPHFTHALYPKSFRTYFSISMSHQLLITYRSLQSTIRKIQSSTLSVKTLGSSPASHFSFAVDDFPIWRDSVKFPFPHIECDSPRWVCSICGSWQTYVDSWIFNRISSFWTGEAEVVLSYQGEHIFLFTLAMKLNFWCGIKSQEEEVDDVLPWL